MQQLTEYTLSQVSNHNSIKDCWLVIFDHVYDITSFLQKHPGGEFILLDYAGRDGTIAFKDTGHGKDSYVMLSNYLIGILTKNQQMYQDYHILI